MTRLLSAGFSRLWKNKLFWLGTCLLSGFMVFVLINNYLQMLKQPNYVNYYTSDQFIMAPFQLIGLFAACFTSMFLGTEYSDGTIRNKLIVGRSRTQVYLSNLLLSFAATLIACAISILITCVVGLPLFGAIQLSLTQLSVFLMIGLLAIASYAAIFSMLSMLLSTKSSAVTICVLGFFLILTVSLNIADSLNVSEFIGRPADSILNPKYPTGMKRAIYQFLADMLPTSLCSQIVAREVVHPLRSALYMLLTIACTTNSGLFHFNRRDLK